jgi:putative oxidoreductase
MTTLTPTWNEGRDESARRSRVTIQVLWALQIFSAAMFLVAGVSKLAGVPMMVQMFGVIGIGQWFRYVTGTIEVVSAVLLLIPSIASYGAAALAVTMIGAIITHLFIVGGNPAMAVVLLASTATIAWTRRSDG